MLTTFTPSGGRAAGKVFDLPWNTVEVGATTHFTADGMPGARTWGEFIPSGTAPLFPGGADLPVDFDVSQEWLRTYPLVDVRGPSAPTTLPFPKYWIPSGANANSVNEALTRYRDIWTIYVMEGGMGLLVNVPAGAPVDIWTNKVIGYYSANAWLSGDYTPDIHPTAESMTQHCVFRLASGLWTRHFFDGTTDAVIAG